MARTAMPKERKPIRRVSKKRELLNAERRIAIAKVVAIRGGCAWPGCNKLGTDPHEPWSRGRTLDIHHTLTCVSGIVMLCSIHHGYVHDHPAEAEEMGLLRRSTDGCVCGHMGRG